LPQGNKVKLVVNDLSVYGRNRELLRGIARKAISESECGWASENTWKSEEKEKSRK
jgi:hypothetical protein